MDELEILRRRVERERAARQAAESIIEAKSRELYLAHQSREEALEALEAANKKLQVDVLWHSMAETFEAKRSAILEGMLQGRPRTRTLDEVRRMAEDEIPGAICHIALDPEDPIGPEGGAEIIPAGAYHRQIRLESILWQRSPKEKENGCRWTLDLLSQDAFPLGVIELRFQNPRRPGVFELKAVETLARLAELAVRHGG